MKLYISADIEGVAGIAHWDETTESKPDYVSFQEQMLREVQEACKSANLAGAKEIWIKDAHNAGRNIDFKKLPTNTTLIRGKSGHPFRMMQEVDSSFDAVLFIGYHSYASSDENPLAHTFNREISYIKINGEYASEFLVNTYIASYVNVPVIFISGDYGVCNQAKRINNNIRTVNTNKGVGDSVICTHPDLVIENIKSNVEEIVQRGNFKKSITPLPNNFDVEISFVCHQKAYKSSFYPNVKKISPTTLGFKTDDYFEFLRMLAFVI